MPVLSAGRHCVPRHAGHVAERPHLGFAFARNAAAEASYSCVRRASPRHKERPKGITGVVQWGSSAIHFIADSKSRPSSSHLIPSLFCFALHSRRRHMLRRPAYENLHNRGALLVFQRYRKAEFRGHCHQVSQRAGLHFSHHPASVCFHGDLVDAELKPNLFVQ